MLTLVGKLRWETWNYTHLVVMGGRGFPVSRRGREMKKGRLAIRVSKVSSLEVDEEKAKRTVLELLSRELEVRLLRSIITARVSSG